MHAPTPSLFDQSELIDRAERLVKIARACGADAADAVAVRSLALAIELRDGAVEETESAEGDDLGLRVLVGKRQAVVSTNDLAGDLQGAGRARGGHGARGARGRLCRPRRPCPAGARFSRSRPDRSATCRAWPRSKPWRAPPNRQALAVQGVAKSGGASASAGFGGMVLVTSTGFRGAFLGSNHGLSMTAIAGSGTGMERDYDYSAVRHAADLESPEKIGRTAGKRAVERLNPRKVSTRKVPVVFDRRVAGTLVSHLASAVNGGAVARKTTFLRDKMGQKLFADGIDIIDDPLRKRGLRSRPFDGEGVAGKQLALIEDGSLRSWLLDCATARELGSPPPATPRAASRPCLRRRRPICTWRRARCQPRRADRRHQGRLLRHRPDRHGRQHGDRRLQPRRLRLLDRERQEALTR